MRRSTLAWLGIGSACLLSAGVFSACGGNHGSGGNSTGSGGHSTSSSGTGGQVSAGDSVLMHHKNPTRDGVYVQPALTKMAAAGLKEDSAFHASTDGDTYAQPLYLDAGPGGKDLLFVATENDNVYALDATTGAEVWKTNLGTPVALSKMGCGNIDPFGVTGTPVIDLPSRTIFMDALVDEGGPKHKIFGLSIDDGSIRSGYPIDVGAQVKSGSTGFKPQFHGERGALAVVNGKLWVPFGGLFGDCGDYHGWIVSVSLADPSKISAWATEAEAGGAWAPGGVASDGTSVFITTGNTINTQSWGGGEAIIRFDTQGFSGSFAEYWAPKNWLPLDNSDVDIGGSGPVLFDVAGSTPSKLAVALGKDGKVYLLDRSNLGGISDPVAIFIASTSGIINAAVAYTTAQGTYVAFKGAGAQCTSGQGGDLTTVRIKAGSPPTLAGSWCASQGGLGSPMVTTTDGHAEAIVWSLGSEGDGQLHGFDGDTGQEVFDGGGVSMPIRRYQTPIAAKGRIFVAHDNGVTAFTL